VEHIYLNNKSVRGCLGCGKCRENPDEINCVQKDDAIDILKQMISSDVVLFASPIYFWGFSAQLKALIDRTFSLVTNYHKPGHTSLMKGKRIELLVTGADNYEENAEGMFTAFDRFSEFLLTENSGGLYVGGCSVPADLPEETRRKASKLALSMSD
jgi:multimeric flavodoxin WrbA